MLREALYLVDNEYATVEDIDRACRNDPGYYLSFAGNFRYMDLMGPYSYALVMKDLNPELSKADKPPAFVYKMLKDGKTGLHTKKGFYNYSEKEVREWEHLIMKFGYQIEKIISKYPFNQPVEQENK